MGTVAVVVMSHCHPKQVQRLIEAVSRGQDTFVAVHHDPSGDPLRGRLPSNALRVPAPVRCSWGRWSVVEGLLRSLTFVRDNIPDITWTLVVSGLDYPIRGMRSIERELASSPADAYLRYFRVGDPSDDVHPWQQTCRRRYFERRRLPLSSRTIPIRRTGRNPFHGGTDLYVGDLWVNLGAVALDKVLDSPLRPSLEAYLRRAPVPDEAFTPSVLFNGAPSIRAVRDSRRFIRWPVTPSRHPLPVVESDLPALRASTAFFARKIDPIRHAGMCAELDALAQDAERT